MSLKRSEKNIGLSGLLLMLWPLWVQGDAFSNLLQRELVRAHDGRWIIEHSLECRFREQAPVYINRYLEAPNTEISRDVAVFLSTRLLFAHQAHLTLLLDPDADPLETVSAMPCRLSEPAAKPDFKITAIMHSDGIRVETVDVASGNAAVDELAWEQVLAEPTGAE